MYMFMICLVSPALKDTVLGDEFVFNSYDVVRFGYRRSAEGCILVTEEMVTLLSAI